MKKINRYGMKKDVKSEELEGGEKRGGRQKGEC